MKFSGPVFAEIGCRGSLEALFAVDGGVDLVIRKYKAVAGRDVFQAFRFTEFEEAGRLLHGGFAFRFAHCLEGFQQGEVLLNGAVQALLVKAEELEIFRLLGENVRGGDGVVELRDIGAGVTAVLELTEGEEVVLDGTETIQTPTVGGDALGELPTTGAARRQHISGIRPDLFIKCDHGSVGREVLHDTFRECVVRGAVVVGHSGDLAGESMAQCVHAGALFARFRFGTCGQKGIAAVRF